MQNFDDLDIEGRNPSQLSEEEREKEEHDRKRLMRSSVTAEDGTLRPVYSLTEDDDIWCHICNIALFGKHKLLSHNMCKRHKLKLERWPYSISLWSKRTDTSTTTRRTNTNPTENVLPTADTLAPGEPIPPGMEDQLMTRSTTIQVSLDRHRTSPLVGLEYLLELVDNESCEPSYTCILCDKRGDPRSVMEHLVSYNHRITYLNRHFPTVSRAITEFPRTPNYKRGANEISVLVAKKIEEVFGRLQPQLVDKYQFEKNKMQYIKRVYEDYHFRERPDRTFMECYDVRWMTNFDEMMAEMSSGGKKDDSQSRFNKLEHLYQHDDNPEARVNSEESMKKEEHKTETEHFSKKIENKDKEKSGWKIRILTKEKLNARKVDKIEEKSKAVVPVRPSDDTKSLSSLSSISSSPSPSRSRSRSRSRDRRSGNASSVTGTDRRKYPDRSRYSRSRSRSRSRKPLRERDMWEKYRELIRRSEETLQRALKFHEKNPEKHPSYPDEWKKFWNRRYKELQADGKDPSKHDFKPEWIEFWNKRMREIHAEELQQRKEEIRKRLELPEDRPPEKIEKPEKPERTEKPEKSESKTERLDKWSAGRASSREKRESTPSSTKRSRHHVESDDDVEYVGTTKTIKTTEYVDRHEPMRDRDYGYTYTRGKAGIYRTSSYYPPSRVLVPSRSRHYPTSYLKEKSPSPPPKEELLREDLEIVGLLRLLTALEGQLGSLGPKIVTLLSRALAAEKAQPNSAEDLLNDEEVCVQFETVKEKLKGQLFAGMIEKVAIAPTKSAIQNIAKLLHKASETKRKVEQLLKQQMQEEEEKRKRREMELTRPLIASFANSSRGIFQRSGDTSKLRSEPVSVPGVGAVDKIAIAQQIAAALVAQGRTNVSQDELETLINAVVGMAEASQHSDKPITAASFVKGLTAAKQASSTEVSTVASSIATPAVAKVPEVSPVSTTGRSVTPALPTTKAPSPDPPILQKSREERASSSQRRDSPPIRHETPTRQRESTSNQRELGFGNQREANDRPKSSRMESLSDNDLKTLLQNFKDLGTDEQHGLINFLKKLEATDLPRVEKLRGYVNLGTPTAKKDPTPPKEIPSGRNQQSKGGRSTSPFSMRKINQNPTDDEEKWKPKLDMFADDEEELKQQQQRKQQHQQPPQEGGKRSKARVDLSDDDDDYSFEDIYKAADKNVSESEKARRRKSSRSRSNSSRSWSRSRSRSPTRSRVSPSTKPRDEGSSDPNAILNETKRLIANIMGDLPNKYVVKSHAVPKVDNVDSDLLIPPIPQLPILQQNLYNSNYQSDAGSQKQQQQTMTGPPSTMAYQQMSNHQFANYQIQQQQQQQQTNFNSNSGAYMNNGYNYNQSYSNMASMISGNQTPQSYSGTNMQTNQYGQQQQQQALQQQQMYGIAPPQYGAQNTGPPIGYPQQQYGNYPQQRFY